MSQRYHALLPDADAAETLVGDLRALGLDDTELHAVARYDPAHDLPEAGIFETTALAPAAGRGAAAGAASGLIAGLAALAFPPLGIVIGGGTVAATGLAGAGFGAWVAGMIGVSESADEIVEYEHAVAEGQVLLLIDVPDDRRAAVCAALASDHPDVRIRPVGRDE